MERRRLRGLAFFAALVVVAAEGCAFDSSGIGSEGSSDAAAGTRDSGFDPEDCTPGQQACSGHILQTCGEDGTLDSNQDVACDFTCAEGQCTFATNLDSDHYDACGSGAPALTPPPDAAVELSADPSIRCDPHCGEDESGIEPIDVLSQGDERPAMALFCLSSVEIPSSATVTGAKAAETTPSVALLVRSHADIAGRIDLRGGDAGDVLGGGGGPGGGSGARLQNASGRAGEGACPGAGGDRDGRSPDFAAGGGGGAGHGGPGGPGGEGRDLGDSYLGPGGEGGGTCGSELLVPLIGGSGGGAGASTDCGQDCGFAGGGGGGALQISAREAIRVSGTLEASGGSGYGDPSGELAGGGGGGGGAGGAVLLEAPTLALSGEILVEGGAGAGAGAGPGGEGAAETTLSGGEGSSFNGAGEGGAGGGGGAGRVRLNAEGEPTHCSEEVSPREACTSSAL